MHIWPKNNLQPVSTRSLLCHGLPMLWSHSGVSSIFWSLLRILVSPPYFSARVFTLSDFRLLSMAQFRAHEQDAHFYLPSDSLCKCVSLPSSRPAGCSLLTISLHCRSHRSCDSEVRQLLSAVCMGFVSLPFLLPFFLSSFVLSFSLPQYKIWFDMCPMMTDGLLFLLKSEMKNPACHPVTNWL